MWSVKQLSLVTGKDISVIRKQIHANPKLLEGAEVPKTRGRKKRLLITNEAAALYIELSRRQRQFSRLQQETRPKKRRGRLKTPSPTTAAPGTPEKIKVLAQRAKEHMYLFHEDDEAGQPNPAWIWQQKAAKKHELHRRKWIRPTLSDLDNYVLHAMSPPDNS